MVILVDISPSICIEETSYVLDKLGLYDTTNSTVMGFDVDVCFIKKPSMSLIYDDLVKSSTNEGTIIQKALDSIEDKNDDLVIITDGSTEKMDLSSFRNVTIHSSFYNPFIKKSCKGTLIIDSQEL